MKKQTLNLAMIALIAALILSACGGAATATPAPTATPVDIAAIYTQAAQTVFAQLTEQAPTLTPTPLFTETPLAPTATVATPWSPTIRTRRPTARTEILSTPFVPGERRFLGVSCVANKMPRYSRIHVSRSAGDTCRSRLAARIF